MDPMISNFPFPEKRTKPRTHCDYPAVVRGLDPLGHKFEEKARVFNLSTSGIFMVASHSIPISTVVNVRIALPTGSLAWGMSRLATNGIVVRNELQSDGAVGIAIKFQGYKFL